MFRLYEVDPDADVLLIIPTPTPLAPSAERGDGASGVTYTRSAEAPSAPPSKDPPTLRIKVSSKHLSLASSRFRDQLRWEWSDANNAQSDGRFHVHLAGLDAKAVTIVMDAIHGRGSRVPRSLDLERLAKVAVFVDEFQCYDAVEAYAERWIGQLERSQPSKYGRDTVLWIFVAYVFRRPDLFKTATRLAILQSTGPISDLGLPIREKIISKLRHDYYIDSRATLGLTGNAGSIDGRRQELVEQVLEILHRNLDDLRDGRVSCVYECDSFILGALTKALHRNNLVSPPPSRPFSGISVASIVEAVGGIAGPEPSVGATARAREGARKRKSSWLGDARPAPLPTPETSPDPKRFASFETHDCAVKSFVTPEIDALEGCVDGLELESSLGYCLY